MRQRVVGVGIAVTALAGGASSASVEVPGKLTLNGSPAYYRVMRLTNRQWTKV